MPDTDVGKRLRMLREARGLTQKEAAEALCIPRTTYMHYEGGSNEPKISMLMWKKQKDKYRDEQLELLKQENELLRKRIIMQREELAANQK